MKPRLLCCLAIFFSLVSRAWEIARPGLEYEFPRDHLVHPDFKTEWWYFTGNLVGANGKRYGFQATFFRQGVNEQQGASAFSVRDLAFAHAAITDIDGKKFYFSQEVSRMSFGEAGFGGTEKVAWIKDWSLRLTEKSDWQFQAQPAGQKLYLTAEPLKSPVIHGTNGISQKAAGEGHASHYYSQTRLRMSGQVTVNGREVAVNGLGWFDHEWATNQLAGDQVGWNWFGLHLDDGRELMLYQMRRANGIIDPASSGTLVDQSGKAIALRQEDFTLTPLNRKWMSPATKAIYPLDWKVNIPSQQLTFTTRACLENQEMALPPVIYWEGATEIEGVAGRGYMELTGYGEALKALRGSGDQTVPK